MKQKDDYISGPHIYWLHFVCGLVFGAPVIGWLATIVAAVVGGLTFGHCYGKWGDRAWKAVFESPRWRVW